MHNACFAKFREAEGIFLDMPKKDKQEVLAHFQKELKNDEYTFVKGIIEWNDREAHPNTVYYEDECSLLGRAVREKKSDLWLIEEYRKYVQSKWGEEAANKMHITASVSERRLNDIYVKEDGSMYTPEEVAKIFEKQLDDSAETHAMNEFVSDKNKGAVN